MKQQNPTNFWGWHYFDVHTADGYDIVFTLHNRPFMSLFNVAIFDFFIYHNHRRILHYFFTLPQTREFTQAEPFLLRFDDHNYIKELNGGMEISAHNERINLQLRLENCLPPAEYIHLRLPLGEKDYFAWQLLAPQSASSGRLSWDNHELSLLGQGYHDRNYGTVHLKSALSGWRWAKFFLPDEMLIVGEMYFRKAPERFVLVRCTKQSCRWTQQATVERNRERLRIHSDLGDFSLQQRSKQRIDHTDFMIPAWPALLQPAEKLRELLAFFTINYKLLQPFKGIFTNGCYERYKSVYFDNHKQEVQAFQERIFF